MKQFYILLMILLCGEFARTQTTTTVVSDLQTPSGIAISGNDMYISELGGGRVIKIDHTQTNSTKVAVTAESGIFAIAINGNDLYYVELLTNKLSRIDVSKPLPTEEVETILSANEGLNGPFDLLVNGTDLYVAGHGNVKKLDLSSSLPITPELVATITPSTILHMDFKGNELYLSEQGSKKLSKLVDVTATPVVRQELLDNPAGEDRVYGSGLIGNDLIYSSENGKLHKVDVTKLPVVLGVDTQSAVELTLSPNPAVNYIQVSGLLKAQPYTIYSTLGQQV